MRSREVGLDLGDRPALGAGELVRKGIVEAPTSSPSIVVADAPRLALERPLAHHEDDLDAEQLVERQPATCGLLLAHRLGEVDRAQRVAAVDQAEPPPHRVGHRIGDAPRSAPFQRVLDPPGDLPRAQRDLLALRVDRHDATGAIADQIDDRVRHLQPTAIHVGLAEQRDLQSLA